ncbi:hypothetical protein [Roseomonas xinghualingensis]|uniref:hypothetical protein n=1 Tax=Roseomonas xinghualingensis TaxID=2986475 RepID=UPI0021F1C0E9|nr:hypothetical protein [Roseomonas sp. SXEYE001]MCV4209985.1 hypothetical protein [Roseomonas sp. SXEYE001]
MTDTVEVVASQPVMVPAGQMEPGDVFTTTRTHADQLAALGVLEMEKGDGPAGERAAAAGAKARAKVDAEATKAARAAAREEKAETAAAPTKAAD